MAKKGAKKPSASRTSANKKPTRRKSARAARLEGPPRGRRAMKKAASNEPVTLGSAQTIVYVHGVGNKPREDVLRCQWDGALFGFRLGERSRMAYWCQTDRHGPPVEARCGTPDNILNEVKSASGVGARALARRRTLDDMIGDITDAPAERRSLERLLKEMEAPAVPDRARTKRIGAEGLEDIDFPDFLVRLLLGAFAADVRDFFFDRVRRERMEESLKQRLETGGGPFVVIAHSQGSMVAYSLLLKLDPKRYRIPLLVTVGSPLGLAEVKSQLRRIHGLPKRGRMPVPACVGVWINFFDKRDPIAQKEKLANHYGGSYAPQDFDQDNLERGEPHSATGYLGLSAVRARVRAAVELQRFQEVTPFVLSADAVRDFERSRRGERRPLLIELTDSEWARLKWDQSRAAASPPASGATAAPSKTESPAKTDHEFPLPGTPEEMADLVVARIGEIARGASKEELRIQRLRRYVSVHLTRDETEELASALPEYAPLYRIWRNAKKTALLDQSIHTLQVSAAQRSYEAYGQGVQWAVLDSGCTPHPHLERSIAARWDCTLDSDHPIEHGTRVGRKTANSHDLYGHGTHVAGIIAGSWPEEDQKICGMAPQAKLHVYKVLDDEGEGDDAWIIKAIDHIARINEKAGAPTIAGVNLSLGGAFEQDVFGCGHTPLCDELRRLWRQGVVVVISAGNEGFARLLSTEGEIPANMPLSIGDPANLDEAIAVGAVHKSKPHTYGTSHFSSRGPTADGRNKPDCVAPGEQILSCRHKFRDPNSKVVRDLYIKMDGTSMAAPHVSGIIAAFLSRRTEFVGHPDRVKKILLENCTDLGRDRTMQGAGMPNLVKMLVQT